MDSIGSRLRQAREEQGLSLQQVFEGTRISRRTLEALESDDFDSFASPVYTRAFLKDYCSFLGIDDGVILSAFEPPPAVQILEEPRRVWPSRGALVALITAGCLLLFGGAIIKVALDSRGNVRESAATARRSTDHFPPEQNRPATGKVPSISIAPAGEISAGRVSVRIRLVQDAWMRVKSGNQILFEGILKAGTVKEFQSSNPIRVLTGNAGGVFVAINGGSERLMGQVGKVEDFVYGRSHTTRK